MKEIKYKECYVVGDCLHIQFVDGESYNFLLDSVVEEMVGGLTPLAPDGGESPLEDSPFETGIRRGAVVIPPAAGKA